MSDEVYEAIARSHSGFVDAPAGCGKTEAIVRTVGRFCDSPQLVLTHTHAGVDALRQRFRERKVPQGNYHVDTIAGWCWGWVRRYPRSARYVGSTDFADWNAVYLAMVNLLQMEFVRRGVLNSYTGTIVDEYQDCTVPMHELIVALATLLPCRVLGDELQGVFDFKEPLVAWNDVKSAFQTDLGSLETPHRWIKAGNEPLGRWLLNSRPTFRQGREPDFRGSPIVRQQIAYRDLNADLIRLTHAKQGRICVIGPKAHGLSKGVQTTLVKQKYRILEPNELSTLRDLVSVLADGTVTQKARAALKFLTTAYGSVPAPDQTFIGKILRCETQRVNRPDRRNLCRTHTEGITPHLLLDLLAYLENLNQVNLKLYESVSALRCILEEHTKTGAELSALYADEIASRKHQNRSSVFRCSGSTLLVKGLEFDHAVILRGGDDWGTHRDLYVALTRGAKSTTLIELTN